MNINNRHFGFRPTLVSLAVLTLCASAQAQDSDITQYTRPSSTVSVGVGAISGDEIARTLKGQYDGRRSDKSTLELEFDINQRDDATGTSLMFKGRNLGLDNREMGISYERQGDWKISADYSELVRHDPRTVNTGMTGVGTTTPTVVRLATPGTGMDYNFQLKRVGMGLSGEKWFGPNLQFELSFKNESKNGERLTSKGYDCAAYVCAGTQSATSQKWALLMMPEPVDSAIRQIEARLNYNANALNISAGYYGSFYTNANGNISPTVPNTLNNPLGVPSTLFPAAAGTVIAGGGTSLQNVLQMPYALPPDNQAHQFYVSGNYRFAPTTNMTFKLARTRATQNESFAASGLAGAPAGISNLGGEVDTTLMQFGLTMRPMPKLSLLANVRYEKKDDNTPYADYNIEAGTSTPATVPPNTNRFWENYHVNSKKLAAKLEGSYQLPEAMRVTVGLDYSTHERPVPISITEEELAGIGAVRAKNQEQGYRLELRRMMSETFSGAISYSNSKRTGGDWTSLSTSAAFVAAGLGYGQTGSASQFIALNAGNAFPMSLVDMDREKVRLSGTWTPTEKLDVQLSLEDGKDQNTTDFSPVALGKGWRQTVNRHYSLDASYAISDNWRINGYVAQGNQNLQINHSTGYMLDLNTRSDAVGFGLSGKVSSKLEIGAQASYLDDTTKYGLAASPSATGAAPSAANLAQVAIGLPDVRYQTTSLSLFGNYALDKKATIRMSVVYQKAKLDEWSWSNNGTSFVYSDNTTVKLNPDQSSTFVGVAYVYRF